jgi:cyanophycinase
MGRTMILGGGRPDVSAAAVRTGPGLGLIPKVLIDMHVGERGRLPRLLSAVALDPDHLGVGIDENTGILVEGGSFEVLGTGVATVADAERATVVHADGDDNPITLFGVRLHLLPAGCIFDFATREPTIGPAHDRY